MEISVLAESDSLILADRRAKRSSVDIRHARAFLLPDRGYKELERV
jgi:hypothetical protein